MHVLSKFSRAGAILALAGFSLLFESGCSVLGPAKAAAPASSTPPPTMSISGRITSPAGSSGVIVTLGGTAKATTTTDSAGNYTFQGLESGRYTVTPSKSQFQFSPAVQIALLGTADLAGLNFTGSKAPGSTNPGSPNPPPPPPTFSLSGTITGGSGATIMLTGSASATTTADSSGNFHFSNLATGTYTLTPSKSQYSFSPANRSASVSTADITGINFKGSPVSAIYYSISGVITPAAGVGGTTVALGGPESKTTTADASGHFSFGQLPAGSYTVTPSSSNFTFSPTRETAVVGSANVGGINFTASPVKSSANTVNIYPGQDIAAAVNAAPAGTTFSIAPGIYRLTRPILPKNGDSFIGQTPCAPPATPCAAVITGSTLIGTKAKFDGTNYEVTDQTQQNARSPRQVCDPGWSGCVYPEDLFFDGVPFKHLYASTLPAIGPGQWWFDYSRHIIYFHDNPSGHKVETSVVNNAFGGAANNVTIQYLTVKEFANMYPTAAIGDCPGGSPQTQAANWKLQNSEVLLNHGAGVRVNYGIQVLNNYIHDNGQLGIGGGLGDPSINANVLIQGNTINHNDFAHFNPGFGSGGFKVGATSGITLRGNTIQNNEGAGIHFDVNSQNEFVDSNIITDNTDSDGLAQEIGYGTTTFRNNVVLRNGAQVNGTGYTYQIAVRASSGVDAYCNVMEISKGTGINGWGVGASDRGYSSYPPYQYLASTNNSFHHNTVIWDAGATGIVGFIQNDASHQPNFFADNARPDFSTYYLTSTSLSRFVYDDNNSQRNVPENFARYQAVRADIHGALETAYSGGYPSVSIISPTDQSSISQSTSVEATASDSTGIDRVEFYVDWALQATATSAPYRFQLSSTPSGTHIVTAVAYSNAGIQACNAITLNKQ